MLATDLAAVLPRAAELVKVDGDTVPKFDAHIPRSEGLCAVTIAPPLDAHGRGTYVSNVCAPMASKKSFYSRIYHWNQHGISVVLAVRVSYALNAMQEWKESAPNATEQDAAARAALADFEDASIGERCKTDQFGPDRATVWCYLTHSKAQLEALFRTGSGVCIVSPRACPAFLRAVRDMGPQAMVDNLYVEEVKALSQMLFTKVLPDTTAIDALSTLATERSRRVVSFCADWLFDPAPACIMQHLVRDRPHLVFDIQAARPHMQRDVALYYSCGLDDAEASVRGRQAFDALYDRLLACCLRHGDFDIWVHVNYEKECVRMYARAVELGIHAVLIIGTGDDDDKQRYLTDFDRECAHAQIIFSTSAVTVGMNFKRNFSACVVVEGSGASGPVEAAQSAGRASRVSTPECEFILWMVGASPPTPDEKLTSLAAARKAVESKRVEKARFAQRSLFASEVVPPLLLDVKAVNEAYNIDKRSHCALLVQKLIKYKPGWTLVDPSAVTLPPRIATLSAADVKATLQAAKPLALDQIQRIDSLTPDQKMQLGYGALVRMAHEAYDGGRAESYAAAEMDVLDTCGGMFTHAHLSDTFVHGKQLSAIDKQTNRAWKAARHFSSLAAFTPKQLLVVESFEDRLNLAACHLTLGSRRVTLARSLLRSAAVDGAKVGLYTRLPERIDALERASKLIGVTCLATQRQVLTVDSFFVRMLQLDKMGAADAEVSNALKRLSVLADTIAGEGGPTGSTKTLWAALKSLLALICVEVVVIKDRKMTISEQEDWLARNDCEGGFLASMASRLVDTTAATEADDVLRQMCGEPSGRGSDVGTETTASVDGDARAASKRQKTSKTQLAREGANLRLPVEVELRRRTFYFGVDGNLLDARKARCVMDGEYRPANAKPADAPPEPMKVKGVDFVGQWRVFSAELGESVAARALLNRQMPLSAVEHELGALMPAVDSPLALTGEQQAVFTTAAAGQGTKRALHVTEKDGCIYMNEPMPAKAFAKELQDLRAQKTRFRNRLCSAKLLEDYRKAPKAEKKRLDREHESKTQDWMGPKRTSQLLWLEAVDRVASQAMGGIRWLPVVYQKKKGFGRDTASYPSLQSAEGQMRRKLMKHVAHDWDIVSCHCFLVEAVLRGFLELDPQKYTPTLRRYNSSRAADVLAGRPSAENEFLASIAQWYGVTVGEAKFGPLVLLNQGTTSAWLKGLDAPREVPAKGDHPDLTKLAAEALVVRKLFFEHAATLFPRGAFDGLRQRLQSDCPDDSLESMERMEKKLFSYCLMHFESVALRICTDASADAGLPALTFVYDGFLQLHVKSGGNKAAEVKMAAEAALLTYFKSPIYLVEKPFFEADECAQEENGLDTELMIPGPP